MEITWIGHSCFRIEEDGYSLIIDPYEDGSVPGLANVRESADAVLCTHEHGDHNFRDGVTLKNSGKPALRVEAIDTFHDDEQGIKRGRNRIYKQDIHHIRKDCKDCPYGRSWMRPLRYG